MRGVLVGARVRSRRGDEGGWDVLGNRKSKRKSHFGVTLVSRALLEAGL